MAFLRGAQTVNYIDEDSLGFVQGPARLLIAPVDQAWPDGIEDIIKLVDSPAGTQYDPVTGWDEGGFTKTGINIVRNNAEEEYDVDQIPTAVSSRPTNWDMNVGTQLAEATLETYKMAWELGPISTVTKTDPQPDERHVGMGAPISYVQKRVAVLFQFPGGWIRAFVFRVCQRMPQESGFTYQKTGEQVSLPTRWRALADTAVTDEDTRFGEIFEQIPE